MSHLESLVFLWRRRVYGGSYKTSLFRRFSKQVVMSFCVAGMALCDIPTCFDNVSKMSKLEQMSHKMLVFLHPRVLSRVSGFPVASPCLWGKAGEHLIFECVQAGRHVVVCGRRGTLWHSNLFDNLSKMSKLEEVSHEMLVLVCSHVSRLESLHGFPVASPCLWGKLRTPHSTLYTPQFTL